MIEDTLDDEQEITIEDAVAYLLEKVELMGDVLSGICDDVHEITIDHKALFMTMRNSGKFSREAYRRYKAIVSRSMEEEDDACQQNTDASSIEGNDRGQD